MNNRFQIYGNTQKKDNGEIVGVYTLMEKGCVLTVICTEDSIYDTIRLTNSLEDKNMTYLKEHVNQINEILQSLECIELIDLTEYLGVVVTQLLPPLMGLL